jgi:hypothetical protein
MFPWLLVIGFLIALWFVLGPRTQKTRESLALRVPFLSAGTTQREKFKLALNDAISARGAALNTPQDFSTWLNSLSNKQLDELVRQVADACRRANVDLNWLLDNRAHGEMERALQDTVLLTALAMYRAHSLAPFARLEAYRQNPNARSNRKFGQQVFARLVDSQSMTIPANLMLAPEKERRTFAHAAIEQAAQENQDALIAIVRETMGTKNGNGKPSKVTSETKVLPPSTANVSV